VNEDNKLPELRRDFHFCSVIIAIIIIIIITTTTGEALIPSG
jgi:hypothetical protein